MPKESFWSAKRVLLERKRSPFEMQKDSFWNATVEKRRFYTCFSYSATHFRLFCDTFQTIPRYISDSSATVLASLLQRAHSSRPSAAKSIQEPSRRESCLALLPAH